MRNGLMLAGIVLLCVLVLLLPGLRRSELSWLSTALLVLALGAICVALVAQAARMTMMFTEGLRRPGDRELPPTGRTARTVCRGALTVWGVAFLLAVPVALVLAPLGEHVTGAVFGTLTLVTGAAVVVGAISGVVWVVTDLVVTRSRRREWTRLSKQDVIRSGGRVDHDV